MPMERELSRHLTKKRAMRFCLFEKFQRVEGMRAGIKMDMVRCIGCGVALGRGKQAPLLLG